jgi:hypothetical protein
MSDEFSFNSIPDLLKCDEILEFSLTSSPIHNWSPLLSDYVNLLEDQEKIYFPDPKAFTRQKDVSEQMRAILIDWLMELSTKFFLRRETVYLAISHIDRLLSQSRVNREDLQILSITCLHIASKSEEVAIPKLSHLLKTANIGKSPEIVLKLESRVLRSLHWQMYPITSLNFLNALLVEWDIYISTLYKNYIIYVNSLQNDRIRQQDQLNRRLVTFKQENTYSYRRFREIVQLLDACVLDFEVYQFKTWKIAAGILYVVCNKCFFGTGYELFWWNSLVFGNSCDGGIMVDHVHGLLENFLCRVFKIFSLDCLSDTLNYLSSYFDLQIDYELPPVCKFHSNIQENYENFLSFQSYTKNNKLFIFKHFSQKNNSKLYQNCGDLPVIPESCPKPLKL